MRGNAWTADQDSALRDQARSGASFTEAGSNLGKTRNSIAGRAHRLGIAFKCDHVHEILSENARKNAQRRWDAYRAAIA